MRKKKAFLMAIAALAMMTSACTKDEQGKVARYQGDEAFSGTNWTVDTNDGEIVVAFDGPFATDWQVDTLAKNTKIESNDSNGYHFKVTKSGSDQIVLSKDMDTGECINRQTLTIDFTADSNKRMYNVTITPSIENVIEHVNEDDLKGLSEDEQDALYSKVAEQNEACRAIYESTVNEGKTFVDPDYDYGNESANTDTDAQASASASADSEVAPNVSLNDNESAAPETTAPSEPSASATAGTE